MRQIMKERRQPARDQGNAVLLSILLLSLLAALATAQFAVVQKNTQASRYFGDYTDLHKYAESGVALALHDLRHNVSGGQNGKIGTVNWTTANDVGKDGYPGTYDEGESDALPTIGEPNVVPQTVGPADFGAGLIVYVVNSAFANVQRVVATASNSTASVTVSTFVQRTITTVPDVGALFVDPDVALDLKGNRFQIDGNDHNPDGTAGAGAAVPGIATAIGDPAGTNEALILGQISSSHYDQVQGAGGEPSIDEAGGMDVESLFESFEAVQTNAIAPGMYSNATRGTPGDMEVTFVEGDLHLSGNGTGAGVLLVEGSVTITGQFTFQGLVIVLGDVRLSGGGAGVHIYGTLVVGESLTAIENGDDSDVAISGTADIFYSSAALQSVQSFLQASYDLVYYEDK